MFAARYFCDRYFPRRYFPAVGAEWAYGTARTIVVPYRDRVVVTPARAPIVVPERSRNSSLAKD